MPHQTRLGTALLEACKPDWASIHCRCGNHARYINARGELCCSLCPLEENIDSMRLTDVPKLLAFSRSLSVFDDQPQRERLYEIIGKGPSKT